MSSSDRVAARPRRAAAIAFMLAALAAAAGCTVQPLYGETTSSIDGRTVTDNSRLSLVTIPPLGNRVGQEVRNQLIFLMSGGKGLPADPAYRLDLGVSALASSAVTIETGRRAFEPTSGIMIVSGDYRLSDARTGKLISAGRRAAQASYDIPAQEFAALRARRDAENRAGRELAEILRLVVAQELERSTSTSVPNVILTPEQLEARDNSGVPASF